MIIVYTNNNNNDSSNYKNKLNQSEDEDDQKKQPDPEIQVFPKEEKTGEGYRRNASVSKSSTTNIPCSRNILDDVSRLEVLIGGKRAGNNSPQIINEATEICQRLFQGKIIGMGLYRNLVNELIDVDYFSD